MSQELWPAFYQTESEQEQAVSHNSGVHTPQLYKVKTKIEDDFTSRQIQLFIKVKQNERNIRQLTNQAKDNVVQNQPLKCSLVCLVYTDHHNQKSENNRSTNDSRSN